MTTNKLYLGVVLGLAFLLFAIMYVGIVGAQTKPPSNTVSVYFTSIPASTQTAVSVTSGTAVKLTVPAGAMVATICIEGAVVRYRDDGTAPTTTTGLPWSPGCNSYSVNLAGIQFIAESTTATMDVAYYKSW